MKFAAALLILLGTNIAAARDTYVNGYYKSNGTYVQPHYRSAPDNNVYNNYSTQGNYNPYTGKAGTKHPNGSGWGSNNNSYQPSGLYEND